MSIFRYDIKQAADCIDPNRGALVCWHNEVKEQVMKLQGGEDFTSELQRTGHPTGVGEFDSFADDLGDKHWAFKLQA